MYPPCVPLLFPVALFCSPCPSSVPRVPILSPCPYSVPRVHILFPVSLFCSPCPLLFPVSLFCSPCPLLFPVPSSVPRAHILFPVSIFCSLCPSSVPRVLFCSPCPSSVPRVHLLFPVSLFCYPYIAYAHRISLLTPLVQVQSLTREKRVEFARMKDNTIQKIEILAASRVNLFSARLEEYHTATQKYFQSSINALKEVCGHGSTFF